MDEQRAFGFDGDYDGWPDPDWASSLDSSGGWADPEASWIDPEKWQRAVVVFDCHRCGEPITGWHGRFNLTTLCWDCCVATGRVIRGAGPAGN